jgi:hypothetical protein
MHRSRGRLGPFLPVFLLSLVCSSKRIEKIERQSVSEAGSAWERVRASGVPRGCRG